MKYTEDEVMQFVQEDDVKFIRLAFCDVSGRQKNISILPGELERAFSRGIPFDGSALEGFGDEVYSDLLLYPDPSTLMVLPWRPEHGKVVRMFSRVSLRQGLSRRHQKPAAKGRGRGRKPGPLLLLRGRAGVLSFQPGR